MRKTSAEERRNTKFNGARTGALPALIVSQKYSYGQKINIFPKEFRERVEGGTWSSFKRKCLERCERLG
jgi:hypothetical protein